MGILARLGVLLAIGVPLLAQRAHGGEKQPLLATLEQELGVQMDGLQDRGESPLYFLGFEAQDEIRGSLEAQFGAITTDQVFRSRHVSIDLRVGTPESDNSHYYGGAFPAQVRLPLDDDPVAIRAAIWLPLDDLFKRTQEAMSQSEALSSVSLENEDASPDFSAGKPFVDIQDVTPVSGNLDAWRERLREYSRLLQKNPMFFDSHVALEVEETNTFHCTSEGTSLQYGIRLYRLRIYLETRADDGMDLFRFKSFNVRSPDALPSDDAIRTEIASLAASLDELRKAPVVEPYVGPAILLNEATGVFFHEVLGHRVEGSELKSEDSSQTLKKKVGQLITTELISVYDDPTLAEFNGVPLNGYYQYDSEGQPARRVSVIDRGVLKGFLMSRRPIEDFPHSTGHGRREAGYPVVSRQGNLFVKGEKTVSREKLIDMLIAECKRQKKEYGLVFEDVSGGFTFTSRYEPNAFTVLPLVVTRISVKDRSSQLVRGVDIIGTPLQAFTKILAVGDDPAVFNGYCGAMSGTVPVAAIAPSVLFSEIEVQKRPKNQEKLPILGAPQSVKP